MEQRWLCWVSSLTWRSIFPLQMYTWIFKTCTFSAFLYMFLVKRHELYTLGRSRYKRNTWQFFVPLYILYVSPNDHLSFFPWNETGFQQMTVDLKGAATAVKHRGFRRGTKHLFEVVPVKVGAAHIQKGSGKVVNLGRTWLSTFIFSEKRCRFFSMPKQNWEVV